MTRLKIVFVFFILVSSFCVSASSQVEDYTHCRGEDGPTSLIVGEGCQLAFESKKGERLYSMQSVVDKDLAQYNARFLSEKAKGFRSNHAFFSFHIGIRLPLADNSLDQEVTWKEFVLFYNDVTKSLEFRDPDTALETDDLRYADFCNHPTQYEESTTYAKKDGQQFSAEIVGHEDHFLLENLPQGVMKTNSGHSETRIFSTLLQHPELFKHLFLSLPAGTKIKYLILKVHSMFDCCCDCQESFKHASLLLRRLLLSRPDLYEGRTLFSKKPEKSWNIPIILAASNYIHYRYNTYWTRCEGVEDLVSVSDYRLPLSHRKPFLGEIVVSGQQLPYILTVLNELEATGQGDEDDRMVAEPQLTLQTSSEKPLTYEANLEGKRITFEREDDDLSFYGLGIEHETIVAKLLENKDHAKTRDLVNRILIEAIEIRETPANKTFDTLRELALERRQLHSSLKFWVGVLNGNLKSKMTDVELLDYLEKHPPSQQNIICNAESLRDAVKSFEECNTKIHEQLLDDTIYTAFITHYITGGGWLNYTQQNLGLLRVIADVFEFNVHLWAIDEDHQDSTQPLKLVETYTQEQSSRAVHFMYQKGQLYFDTLRASIDHAMQLD